MRAVRRLTLRLRIVLALLALVAAGLLVADVVTHESLQSYLYDRVDKQLAVTAEALRTGVFPGSVPNGSLSGTLLPSGTYEALIAADGSIVRQVMFVYSGHSPAAPALPHDLPARVQQAGGVLVASVHALSGTRTYRVQAVGPSSQGTYMVVGIPLTEVQATLHHVFWIEVLVTLTVLIAVGAAAWWLVRRELRPLEGMARTAGAIAEGDLAQRVEPAEADTEVGRLGLALNAMLARIEEAFAQREASEKRLRRFLADASHELRTPLTSIRGYAELFHRGAAQRPEDLAIAMRRIEDEARRMGVVVEDLLLLARLDDRRPLQHEPTDLAQIVGDAVRDAQVTAPGRHITLDSPASVELLGDDNRLRQVVTNLLGNALRHTPPDSPVEVRLAEDDRVAVLAVTDHGPGIGAEHRQRVFEPFYRADENRSRDTGGAGLGLAIVKAVVEAHGGSVVADETAGGGATFTVRLPLEQAEPSGEGADNGRPENSDRRTVVDPVAGEASGPDPASPGLGDVPVARGVADAAAPESLSGDAEAGSGLRSPTECS